MHTNLPELVPEEFIVHSTSFHVQKCSRLNEKPCGAVVPIDARADPEHLSVSCGRQYYIPSSSSFWSFLQPLQAQNIKSLPALTESMKENSDRWLLPQAYAEV